MHYRLWVHELYREFCDQLTEATEVSPIFSIIVSTIKSNFRDKIHTIFDKLCNEDGSVSKKIFSVSHMLLHFIFPQNW